jgi:hypothetical protein
VGQARFDVRVGHLLQLLAHRADGAKRRQALLGVVAVHLQVLADQGIEQGVRVLAQRPLRQQDGPQRPGLVEDPGVHGGDELVARHEVHLQCQDAEQQVTVRVRLRHGRSPSASVRRMWQDRQRGYAKAELLSIEMQGSRLVLAPRQAQRDC